MSWLSNRDLIAKFKVKSTEMYLYVTVTPQDWPYLESARVREALRRQLDGIYEGLGDRYPIAQMEDLEYVETCPDRMTTTLKIAGNKAGVPYYDISTGDGKVTRRAAVKDHYLRTGEIVDNGKGPRPASLAEGAPMYDTHDPYKAKAK